MNVFDIFSGIGAFSLGLERAGMRTIGFCESDYFCRRILKKHWPAVRCYDDVKQLTAERLRADGIGPIDVVCGGWPCQDISVAGKGAGLGGKRSGLWTHFARIIGDIRPLYVCMENVSVLTSRGLDRILGDLAALGFDAEWHCIPASAVGAPHRRDRIWIVANASGERIRDQQQRMPGRRAVGVRDEGNAEPGNDGAARHVADTNGGRWGKQRDVSQAIGDTQAGQSGDGSEMADSDSGRREGCGQQEHRDQQGAPGSESDRCDPAGWRDRAAAVADSEVNDQRAGLCADQSPGQWRGRSGDGSRAGDGQGVPDTIGERLQRFMEGRAATWSADGPCNGGNRIWWAAEPDVGRVVNGDADRLDRRARLVALGNSLVPQIPEMIGRAILSFETDRGAG